MTAQYTPGPWTSDQVVGGVRDAMGHLVADTVFSDFTVEQDEANARLIAAAPELLASLKLVIENNTIWPELRANAHAAILKAEGRQ